MPSLESLRPIGTERESVSATKIIWSGPESGKAKASSI